MRKQNKKTIVDPMPGLSYTGKQTDEQIIYVDRCWRVSPNNEEVQEIQVDLKTMDDREVTLIFTPDDWLDTFSPSMFEQVKKEYIKHIKKL